MCSLIYNTCSDYSNKSPLWQDNEALMKELGYEDEEDGSSFFLMLWRDFVHCFQSVDICAPLRPSPLQLSAGAAAGECPKCRVEVLAAHWVTRQVFAI